MSLPTPSYQKRTALVSKAMDAIDRGWAYRYWYHDMTARLVDMSGTLGYSVEWLACVMSASSPRVRVKRNLAFLAAVAEQPWKKPDGMMQNVWAAVSRVIQAPPGRRHLAIKGRKTRAFAANLWGNEDAVTLDVWMARHFDVDQSVFRTKLYDWYADVIREAAQKAGTTPARAQAAIWADTMIQFGRNPG